MNLEQMLLQVRPRTPWESMDLAVRLIISHWRLLLAAWLVTVIPLILVICLVLLKTYPVWAFFLVWFLKPLYDRIPLFVLSRVIFAETTTVSDVLNALPALLKTGIISSLTLFRLDPKRAFNLPVRQLEGLKAKDRRRRMNTLNRGNNKEILFFVLCFHLESFLYFGLTALLLMLLPQSLAQQGAHSLFIDSDPGLLVNAVSMGVYIMVMSVMECLYVAGGFVLYLNRRIILEGWDIELAFRKLTARQEQLKSSIANVAAVLLACSVVFLGYSWPNQAQAASSGDSQSYQALLPPLAEAPLAPAESGRVIKEVMTDPVFDRFKETKRLKYTGDKSKKAGETPSNYPNLAKILDSMGETLAFIFEAALWLLVLLMIFLLFKYRHRLAFGFGKKQQQAFEIPETLFGLDVRQESLPDDVSGEAWQLYQSGQYRLAMALLYRATLAYLARNYSLNLPKGATEGDCVKVVRHELSLSCDAQRELFIELTQAWQLTAYAHRTVAEQDMRQLCDNWRQYYSERPAASDIKESNNV